MLTRNEAEERAVKIWGSIIEIEPSPILDKWYIKTKDNIWHNFDGNGHPKCHAKCMEREDKI